MSTMSRNLCRWSTASLLCREDLEVDLNVVLRKFRETGRMIHSHTGISSGNAVFSRYCHTALNLMGAV